MAAAWLRGLGSGWIAAGVMLMPQLSGLALTAWATAGVGLAAASLLVDRRAGRRWRKPRGTNVQIVSDAVGTTIRVNGVDIAKALSGATLELDPRGNALTLRTVGNFTVDADVQAELDKVEVREDTRDAVGQRERVEQRERKKREAAARIAAERGKDGER